MIKRTMAAAMLACLLLTGAKCSVGSGMHQGQPVRSVLYWDGIYPSSEWHLQIAPKGVHPLGGWRQVGWTRRGTGRRYGVWVRRLP